MIYEQLNEIKNENNGKKTSEKIQELYWNHEIYKVHEMVHEQLNEIKNENNGKKRLEKLQELCIYSDILDDAIWIAERESTLDISISTVLMGIFGYLLYFAAYLKVMSIIKKIGLFILVIAIILSIIFPSEINRGDLNNFQAIVLTIIIICLLYVDFKESKKLYYDLTLMLYCWVMSHIKRIALFIGIIAIILSFIFAFEINLNIIPLNSEIFMYAVAIVAAINIIYSLYVYLKKWKKVYYDLIELRRLYDSNSRKI